MKTILVISYILLATIHGQLTHSNDRWKYVTYGENCLCYYDTETIKSSDSQTTLWVKFVFIKDEVEDGKPIDYEIYKWVVYCNSRSISEKDCNVYFKDGSYKNIYVSSVPYEVIPDSIGEEFYKYFCK